MILCKLQTIPQTPNHLQSGVLNLMVACGITKTLLLSGYYDSKFLNYSSGLHRQKNTSFLPKQYRLLS